MGLLRSHPIHAATTNKDLKSKFYSFFFCPSKWWNPCLCASVSPSNMDSLSLHSIQPFGSIFMSTWFPWREGAGSEWKRARKLGMLTSSELLVGQIKVGRPGKENDRMWWRLGIGDMAFITRNVIVSSQLTNCPFSVDILGECVGRQSKHPRCGLDFLGLYMDPKTWFNSEDGSCGG